MPLYMDIHELGSVTAEEVAKAHAKDMEMPPPNNKSGATNLSPHEIALLKQWIDQGAAWPAEGGTLVRMSVPIAQLDSHDR